jgi:SAM-dependent methyltransferase
LGVKLVDDQSQISVDCVVMLHVLEHLPDPLNFMKIVMLSLKSGGAIFIEVPCNDWMFKEIYEPHVLFFDKCSLNRLLSDLGFVDIEINYYGQKISTLKRQHFLHSGLIWIRAKAIRWGIVLPFAKVRQGMEDLIDPFERAIVAPFKAHEESIEPATWLRAVARKP